MSRNRRLAAFFRDRAARGRLEGSQWSWFSEQLAADYQADADEEVRQKERNELRWDNWQRERNEKERHEEALAAQEEVADLLESLVDAIEAPRRIAERKEHLDRARAEFRASVLPALADELARLGRNPCVTDAVRAWLGANSAAVLAEELGLAAVHLDAGIETCLQKANSAVKKALQARSAEEQLQEGVALIRAIHTFLVTRQQACPVEWVLWDPDYPVLSSGYLCKRTQERTAQIEHLRRLACDLRMAISAAQAAAIIEIRSDGTIGHTAAIEALRRLGPEYPARDSLCNGGAVQPHSQPVQK